MNFFDLDKIGICTSSVCAVHCALTPILLLVTGAHGILDHELLEYGILMLTGIVAVLSIIPAYLKHRRLYVLVLFLAGLLMVFSGESHPSLWTQLTFSVGGAALMAYAHVENLKLRTAYK